MQSIYNELQKWKYKSIGIVKWYNEEKGFGLLVEYGCKIKVDLKKNTEKQSKVTLDFEIEFKENNHEVFLHSSNWKDSKQFDNKTRYLLEFETGFQKGKISARNCQYFKSTNANWYILLQFVGGNEFITFHEKHSNYKINIIEAAINLIDDINELIIFLESFEFLAHQRVEEEKLLLFESIAHANSGIKNEDFKATIIEKILGLTIGQSDIRFDLWQKKTLLIDHLDVDDIINNISKCKYLDIEGILRTNIGNTNSTLILEKWIENYPEVTSFEDIKELSKLIELKRDDLKVNKSFNQKVENCLIDVLQAELEKYDSIESSWDIRGINELIEVLPVSIDPVLLKKVKQAIDFYIVDRGSSQGIVLGCEAGLVENQLKVLLEIINDLDETDLDLIFNGPNDEFDSEIKYEILNKLSTLVGKQHLSLHYAKLLSDEDFFKKLDQKIFNSISQVEYFNLWSKRLGNHFPEQYLESYFNHDNQPYLDCSEWLKCNSITIEQVGNIFSNIIASLTEINNRKEFYTIFNIFQYILNSNSIEIEGFYNEDNRLHQIVIWFLENREKVNLDYLKGKFILFNPDHQVLIIKKLFWLKSRNLISLDTKILNDIVRTDLDLYLINEQYNDDIILDISTDIIINSLLKFEKEGKFLIEGELLSIVIKDIGLNKKQRFKFKEYFDLCFGRTTGNYNWQKSNGSIKKIEFGNNQYYYAISFSSGTHKWVSSRTGGYNRFVPNPMFDELKDAVKRIKKCKWNPTDKHWGIPSSYGDQVSEFASEYDFFLDFEGSNYKNNPHLVEYSRDNNSKGNFFCDGIEAQAVHKTYNKEFWWCKNQPCFETDVKGHKIDEYNEFSLLDFIWILKLDVVEKSRYGKFDHGKYIQFVSLINRFRLLLDKIYCRSCHEILYPVESSNFAAYSVVRFNCVNNNCTEFSKIIYLNHCLNGKCKSIIDSRDSQKCSNGLYICSNCGSCCSHGMFERRHKTLTETGGFIPTDLLPKIKEKKGHLERAEYFCYKCSGIMKELSDEVFECEKCSVKYYTEQYRISRSHKYLRRSDYPKGTNKPDTDINDEDTFF
jgi:hypothetical protein